MACGPHPVTKYDALVKPFQRSGVRTAMRHVLAVVILALSSAAGPAAAQAPVAVQALGPQPGTRVPDFTATDQNGGRHTLQSLLGPKGAMLVFSRSADW